MPLWLLWASVILVIVAAVVGVALLFDAMMHGAGDL